MKKYLLILFVVCLLMVGGGSAASVTIPISEDSRVSHYNGAWDTNHILSWYKVQAGTTNYFNRTATTSGTWINTYESPVYRRMDRGLLTINLSNTSQIPAGSTITGADLILWGSSKGTGTHIITTARLTNATPANPYVHVYTDYAQYKDVMMSDNNITRADWSITSTNTYALNTNGIQYLQNNIGGSATFSVRSGMDINAVIEGSFENYEDEFIQYYTSDSTNATLKPAITITFTPPVGDDTIPPASITNLANVTTCNSVNFTWTNPADADFNGTMNWFNGAAQTNLTKTDTFKLFSGLAENTAYTFSTKTFDTTGNVNTTFVNLTSTTPACPLAPVASFVITLTDTSTNTPISWQWNATNLLGNNTEVIFSTAQNPTMNFGIGNYLIKLTATNAVGSSSTTKNIGLDLSSPKVYFWNRTG
jgi:hypothetical protein